MKKLILTIALAIISIASYSQLDEKIRNIMVLHNPQSVKVAFNNELGDTTCTYAVFNGEIEKLVAACEGLCTNPPINFILIYNGLDVQFADAKKSYQKTYADIEAVCSGCIEAINDKAKTLK